MGRLSRHIGGVFECIREKRHRHFGAFQVTCLEKEENNWRVRGLRLTSVK